MNHTLGGGRNTGFVDYPAYTFIAMTLGAKPSMEESDRNASGCILIPDFRPGFVSNHDNADVGLNRTHDQPESGSKFVKLKIYNNYTTVEPDQIVSISQSCQNIPSVGVERAGSDEDETS